MMKKLHKLFANSLLMTGLFMLLGIPVVSLGFITAGHRVTTTAGNSSDVLSATDKAKDADDADTKRLIEKFERELMESSQATQSTNIR